MLHRECAEAAQFHAVTTRKSGDDFIENGIHDVLDIPLVKMRVVLGDALNEFGFDHRLLDPCVRAIISLKKPRTVKSLIQGKWPLNYVTRTEFRAWPHTALRQQRLKPDS
jgi:hypothetical protein